MKISSRDFVATEGDEISLRKWPTRTRRFYRSDDDYRTMLQKHLARMDAFQRLLYASNSYSVLLIFQAMDAAGKDSVIRHVMSGINPQGCQVFSFKHPSPAELQHDFLWRTTRALPERGKIGIFNRSYYEEVLIARVHPEILHAERVASEKHVWKGRYRSIVEFENHLHRNGTRIAKIFLHLSKEEQRKRFLARIDEPEKNWKFNSADVEDRKYWRSYMQAYEHCIAATTTRTAPWYIVPADDKQNARLIVSQIVLDLFGGLNMEYPQIDPDRRRELAAIREQLRR